MIVFRTEEFDIWLRGLRDRTARARIEVRLTRLELGLVGNAKPVGEGVSELRIPHGPGYRVYFMKSGAEEFLVLLGGTKSSQRSDIREVISMARALNGDLDE